MQLALSDAKTRLSEVVRSIRATGRPVILTVDGEPAVEIRQVRSSERTLRRQDLNAFDALLGALPHLWTPTEPFDAVAAVSEGRR
jgi:prevent-host-death family protein